MTPRARRTLTLEEAAQRLGVHYMTAYRYVRLGRLPARRHQGRWVVDPDDVDSFQHHTTTTDIDLDAPPERAAWGRHRQRLVRRLMNGDEAGAWEIVERVLAGGSDPSAVHIELVGPAMRAIGERWAKGEAAVGEEHNASSVAMRIVARLGPRFARRGRRRGAVLLAGPPGEQHTLPLAILGDLLRGAGYDVIDLGADTPNEDIALMASRADRLLALCLEVGSEQTRATAKRTIAYLRDAVPDVPILIGGPGSSAGDASALGADLWAGDARDVITFLDVGRTRARARNNGSADKEH